VAVFAYYGQEQPFAQGPGPPANEFSGYFAVGGEIEGDTVRARPRGKHFNVVAYSEGGSSLLLVVKASAALAQCVAQFRLAWGGLRH
jgi:hypothetical protein